MSSCSVCEKSIDSSSATDLVCGSCVYTKKSGTLGKHVDEVATDMLKAATTKPTNRSVQMTSNTIKVKSNSLRNKTALVDDLSISFDKDGFGFIPAEKLSVMAREMEYRPGRYELVSLELPKPQPVAEPMKAAQAESGVEFDIVMGDEPEDGVGFDVVVGDEPEDGVETEVVIGDDEPKVVNKKKSGKAKKK